MIVLRVVQVLNQVALSLCKIGDLQKTMEEVSVSHLMNKVLPEDYTYQLDIE